MDVCVCVGVGGGRLDTCGVVGRAFIGCQTDGWMDGWMDSQRSARCEREREYIVHRRARRGRTGGGGGEDFDVLMTRGAEDARRAGARK